MLIPHRHMGIDRLLAEGAGDRDAVVAIPDEIDLANLDQLDGRQGRLVDPGPGYAYPAIAHSFMPRVEIRIEIVLAPFCPADIFDRHHFRSNRMLPVDLQAAFVAFQVNQLAALPLE